MKQLISAALAAAVLSGCVAIPAPYYVEAPGYYPAPAVGVYAAPGYYHPRHGRQHHRRHYR